MQSKSNNTRIYKFFSGAVVTVKNKEVVDDRGVFLGYDQSMTIKWDLGFGAEPFEFNSPMHVEQVVRKIKFDDGQLPLDAAAEQLHSAGVTISKDTNFDEPAEDDDDGDK